MAKINAGRVIAGGLLAGVVLNIQSWIVGMVLMPYWRELAKTGLLNTPGPAAIWSNIADFMAGLLIAWLYAAIRPRFGPGPRTAIIAGLAGWALAWGYAAIGQLVWMPCVWQKGAVTMAAGGLIGSLAAAWLAGWVYVEPSGGGRRRKHY